MLNLTKKACLLLALPLLLAACSSGEPVVEETNRILVTPFDCTILPQENADTAVMLQNMISSQIVYLLQSAGVPAEQYVMDADTRAASAYASLMPASRSVGKGLLSGGGNIGIALPPDQAASTFFEEVTDWNTQVVPPRDMQQYGGQKQIAEDKAEAVSTTPMLPLDIRAKAMEEAKKRGFDYIIAGTISMVRTEVSPTVRVKDAERATVRAELNCAYQLIYVKKGNVTKAGAAQGRDAKTVRVQNGSLDDYHVVNALDKVLHQAVYNVSVKAGETLTDKKLAVVNTEAEVDEERSYYQDSPGKRLRPETE